MVSTDAELFEKRSAAITLSDMEMFIFPELIYSLVLANIMSPRIWRWRDDPWFAGLEDMKPYKRITRLKQFIMDNYAFNLDLETWGLTTTERELARFNNFIDHDTLAQSNALFGYEGDKYYFDIDIRTHFGLDKYGGDVIPYWKTETVEAMDAFRYKDAYLTGAGECVSLATLYAAALFIVARVPLKDIYLMATPLHSQNFIDVNEGVLTNNRRLVTKNMWFNGTALSAQARRALDNERVTIMAHESGWIHAVYPEATISPDAFAHFKKRLKDYLKTPLTHEILGNFIRHATDIQKCFQLRTKSHGRDLYIGAEKALAYEFGSPYRLTDNTRDKLLADISMDEFQRHPLPKRIVLNDLEDFVRDKDIDINDDADVLKLKEQFASDCLNAEIAIESLSRFCHIPPRLPEADSKTIMKTEEPLGLHVDMDREDIISRLAAVRDRHPTADMAFYAFRDLNRTSPEPFIKAAVERNPVSIEETAEFNNSTMVDRLNEMPNESIYDDPGRLAQPDEVWNYGRGDGAEKAMLLANILRARHPGEQMTLAVGPEEVILQSGTKEYTFTSTKGLADQTWSIPQNADRM